MSRHTIATALVGIMLLATLPTLRADFPAGYYDDLAGKCGAALMEAVRARCSDHTEIPYGTSTWEAFHYTDVRNVGGTDYWWDMYSPDLVAVSSGHPGMNIEHSVANSWWGGTKNAAYKDIVHLNPSDQTANSRKSNYPICELGSVTWTNGVTSVGSPKSGQGGGSSYGYEPCDEYKGDFARVFMYMFAVYSDLNWKYTWMIDKSAGTMFAPWASSLVMRWHLLDPVSDKERSRNDGVQSRQGNRNPFVDLPDLADHIWGAKSNVPYGEATPVNPPDNPSKEEEFHWLDSSSATPDADWTYEDTSLPEDLAYIWSCKENSTRHYLNGSAYVGGKPYPAESWAWGPAVDMADVVSATLTFEHAAKFQTTCREQCCVAVETLDDGAVTRLQIPSWPAPGSWTFVPSGAIDLGRFAGRDIRIGLRYGSTATGADTWEISDMRLKLERGRAGIAIPTTAGDPAADGFDDSVMVEVWGDCILAPDGSEVFDMTGRRVQATHLPQGIYIVTKPSFSHAVKVMVK